MEDGANPLDCQKRIASTLKSDKSLLKVSGSLMFRAAVRRTIAPKSEIASARLVIICSSKSVRSSCRAGLVANTDGQRAAFSANALDKYCSAAEAFSKAAD